MTAWLRLRWIVVTFIGCLYCFIAPRLYYGKRK